MNFVCQVWVKMKAGNVNDSVDTKDEKNELAEGGDERAPRANVGD
jgi:hypothetical protein